VDDRVGRQRDRAEPFERVERGALACSEAPVSPTNGTPGTAGS
jgi:hypothetical protein